MARGWPRRAIEGRHADVANHDPVDAGFDRRAEWREVHTLELIVIGGKNGQLVMGIGPGGADSRKMLRRRGQAALALAANEGSAERAGQRRARAKRTNAEGRPGISNVHYRREIQRDAEAGQTSTESPSRAQCQRGRARGTEGHLSRQLRNAVRDAGDLAAFLIDGDQRHHLATRQRPDLGREGAQLRRRVDVAPIDHQPADAPIDHEAANFVVHARTGEAHEQKLRHALPRRHVIDDRLDPRIARRRRERSCSTEDGKGGEGACEYDGKKRPRHSVQQIHRGFFPSALPVHQNAIAAYGKTPSSCERRRQSKKCAATQWHVLGVDALVHSNP